MNLAVRSQLRTIGLSAGALFLPLLFPLCTGRVFTKDDLGALHLPFRYLYREALRSGDSFLWTSVYRSGFYLHGEGEAGMAHPLHLLLYRWLPLGPAFNLEIVSSYLGMLAGTGVLLRRLGLSTEAAWFGAMAFTFSGFNLFNLMHVNHIAAVAHVPWVLLGGHVLLTSTDRTGRARGFATLAMAIGSQLLVGNPQYVWLTLVALGFMTICLLIAGVRVSRVLLLAGALMLGALVGGAQLLPTLAFAQASTRTAWSLEQSLSFSLAPLNLVQLFSPFAFRFRIHAPESEAFIVHEFIVYNGAFCTLALAWLVMRWRQQARQGLLIALLAFAAVSFVLAMGRYGLVYGWLAHLPGLRSVRAPARHLVLFQLALSGIAAVVFDDLLGLIRRGEKTEWRRLWPIALTIAMSVALTVGAGVLAQSPWSAARGLMLSGVMRAAPWAGIVVGMAVLVAMAARGIQWSLPVLIVCVALDQGLWGYSYAYRWGPIQSIAELAADADVPPGAQRGDLLAPAIEGGRGNLAVLRGMRLTPGYTGLAPASVLDITDRSTQRIAGVAWRETEEGRWVPVPDSMPRARLVSTVQRSNDVKSDLHAIDISRIALVDRDIDAVSGSPGSVNVLEDRPGSIVVDTHAGSTQLLVLTERFHEGWRVRQDDRTRDTARVYGDYLGCVVDAGEHRVRLTFAPDSARRGLQASVIGLTLTLVATSLLWVERR
jgi:hypothetical protein